MTCIFHVNYECLWSLSLIIVHCMYDAGFIWQTGHNCSVYLSMSCFKVLLRDVAGNTKNSLWRIQRALYQWLVGQTCVLS